LGTKTKSTNNEKYNIGKCLPYEDPEVFKSTPFDLQIKIENSIPVEEKSNIIYILDPFHA
jgi:hypothetical protein